MARILKYGAAGLLACLGSSASAASTVWNIGPRDGALRPLLGVNGDPLASGDVGNADLTTAYRQSLGVALIRTHALATETTTAATLTLPAYSVVLAELTPASAADFSASASGGPDRLSLSVEWRIAANDRGKPGSLFIATLVGEVVFLHDGQNWRRWSGGRPSSAVCCRTVAPSRCWRIPMCAATPESRC